MTTDGEQSYAVNCDLDDQGIDPILGELKRVRKSSNLKDWKRRNNYPTTKSGRELRGILHGLKEINNEEADRLKKGLH